jgi:hypothetical protein
MKVQCLQIWKNPAIYNRFQVVYIVKHYVFGLLFFSIQDNETLVIGFATTYAINVYHHWYCGFDSRSRRGVHYVIKFVSDMRQVSGFLWVLWSANVIMKLKIIYCNISLPRSFFISSYKKLQRKKKKKSVSQYVIHGSWIYNYLCHQCLSPIKLWVGIPLKRGELDTTFFGVKYL